MNRSTFLEQVAGAAATSGALLFFFLFLFLCSGGREL